MNPVRVSDVRASSRTSWLEVASLELPHTEAKKKPQTVECNKSSEDVESRSCTLTLHGLNEKNDTNGFSNTPEAEADVAASMYVDSFNVDLAVCCLTVVLYVADYILDLILVLKYYRLQVIHPPYVVYFWLSLGFCLLPPLLGLIYELIWDCEEKTANRRTVKERSLPVADWIRALFALLFLGPVIKFVLSVMYARKSRLSMIDNRGGSIGVAKNVKDDWKRRAEIERSQAAFLCVVEKFVESSLHLIHQLSLIRTEWHTEHRIYIDWIEWLKVGICLFLMPFTLTVYASFRRTAERRTPMNVAAGCVHFVWALLVVSSQAASMSLFATHQPAFFGSISAVHYCLSFVYVCTLALPPSRRIFFVGSRSHQHQDQRSKSSTISSGFVIVNRAFVSCGYVAAESFHRLVVSYLFFFVFIHLKPGTSSNVFNVNMTCIDQSRTTASASASPYTNSVTATTRLGRTGSTLHPALVFYALLIIERSLMVVIWNENCVRHGPADVDCRPTLVSFFAAFAAGLALMIFYYTCVHPANKRTSRSQRDT